MAGSLRRQKERQREKKAARKVIGPGAPGVPILKSDFFGGKKITLCQRIEWYVARINQIAALGYVSYTNQIASDRLCMYNRSNHNPEAPRVPVFELSLFF